MKKKQEILFTPMKAKPGEEVGYYFGKLEPFVKAVEDIDPKRVIEVRRMKKGGNV